MLLCDVIGVCVLSWILIGCVMAFQSMLCVYVKHPHPGFSALDMISPLLVVLGWVLILAIGVVAAHESQFQVGC